MKFNPIYITLILTALFTVSCNKSDDLYEGYEQSLIVDGSIELNGYPRVFLTKNIPYYVNVDSADLIYLVLRQAKVTVSDGSQSEILTLKYNSSVFPPFYYEGNSIKGKSGHSYQLTINYGDKTLTAITTIPEPIVPDTAWFQLNTGEDSLGILNLSIQDNPLVHNFYITKTMEKHKQDNYYMTLISAFDDQYFNGENYTFHLNKGPETYLALKSSIFYYTLGDTILLKLSTTDSCTHAFWKSYKEEVANGANPFASSYHKINSNINGPGKGIWAGYGSCEYTVVAK